MESKVKCKCKKCVTEDRKMTNCAIVGINWGDEGKGRMVDLLTEDYDVVVRFQCGGSLTGYVWKMTCP